MNPVLSPDLQCEVVPREDEAAIGGGGPPPSKLKRHQLAGREGGDGPAGDLHVADAADDLGEERPLCGVVLNLEAAQERPDGHTAPQVGTADGRGGQRTRKSPTTKGDLGDATPPPQTWLAFPDGGGQTSPEVDPNTSEVMCENTRNAWHKHQMPEMAARPAVAHRGAGDQRWRGAGLPA